MKINRWWILASGPSLTKEDAEKLEGQNICVINTTYQLCPNADILYACDPHWWDWHAEDERLLSFKGQKWTQDKKTVEKYKDLNLHYIESKHGNGISEIGPILTGSHSGIQAINLIYQLYKPEEIYLLGYDMQITGDKPHWHGHHPNKVVPNWNSWIRFYDDVARDAERLGVQIINCTRETALTCFPRKALSEVL